MKWIKWSQLLLFAVLAAGPMGRLAVAQTKPVKVEQVPVRPGTSVNGSDVYAQYCAVCHGKDATGNGPAAAALKKAPTDLTRITRNNGGKFSTLSVQQAIANTDSIAAHGAPGMPVWGELLQPTTGDTSVATLRVHNLMKYIEGLQK
jgi:mono/diheme cytochrome c family protein